MIINLSGYQKILFTWAKALGPKLDGYFLKEINLQVDLVFNFIKEIGGTLTFLEEDYLLNTEISLFNVIRFSISWVRNCDHPGITINTNLLFIGIRAEYRDLRHYDYDKEQLKHPSEF